MLGILNQNNGRDDLVSVWIFEIIQAISDIDVRRYLPAALLHLSMTSFKI